MPSDYQNDALRSLSHDKTGGAESGGDELRKLWPTVPSDEMKDVSGIEEAVARVRDALDGVPDDTTLYARGMKLTGWRHEVTAGEVRALIAAVDTRTRERDEAVELLDLAQQEAPRVLADALAPIEAERDRYRAALVKYGVHEWSCQMATGGDGSPPDDPDDDVPCTCGLNAALTEDA